MPTRWRLRVAALSVCVSLTGCGVFYWVKPGASLEDFNRDNTDCIAQTSPRSLSD